MCWSKKKQEEFVVESIRRNKERDVRSTTRAKKKEISELRTGKKEIERKEQNEILLKSLFLREFYLELILNPFIIYKGKKEKPNKCESP